MIKTTLEIISLSTQFLKERNILQARRISEELLSFILNVKRIDLYMQFDRPLHLEEMEKMRNYLRRASTGEPVEYILGEVDFYGCRLTVTPDVLIPRPESEILVDLALKEIQKTSYQTKTLWDICTGSACLALAIKRKCPELTVVGSDLSQKALDIAERNKIKNQLDVEFRIGDMLTPFANEKADFVISNPPYVSDAEYNALSPSVRSFEPAMALKGGERGADFYERLARELPPYLNANAKLFFEIGSTQGRLVQEIFKNPPWRSQRLLADWAGHDRFFFLEIE